MSKPARSVALCLVLILNLMLIPFGRASMNELPQSLTKRQADDQQARYLPLPYHAEDGYMIRDVDGQASCTEATPEEIDLLKETNPDIQLRQINHVGEITAQQTGLKIILRATASLEANATAKQAFTTAAGRWEALIQNPITVIIDVDFGTTFFGGTVFGSGVIGGALGQIISTSPTNYPDVRSRLVSGASGTAETTLYNALPQGTVLTDLGPTTTVASSTAVFRALGSLGAVADPTNETTIGLPPKIGFNSAFSFDFDPSNGIDSDKTDFDAVATHEIGHVLGFTSRVGNTGSPTVSILDLFRFRPGMSLATFPTATRIETVGGTQIFYAGGSELGLSTGSPSGTGGDGQQASHWKDDAQSGIHVGIMDPTIARGVRQVITSNDLLAFDAFGYRLMGSAPPPEDDAVVLASGVPQTGSISAPSAGGGVLGGTQYSIQVPTGATQLKIDLNGNQDVDLLVRFGTKIVIQNGQPVSDYDSSSTSGTESITITAASSPPLRQGTYYIAIGNFGPGAANYTVNAAVTTGGGGGGGGTAPTISTLSASLNGDVLTFTGSATDPDGDFAQVQSALLNESDQVLATTNPVPVNFGASTAVNFTINFPGVNGFLTAVKATLVFIDSQNNRSATRTVDFSQADAGGPTIKNVNLSGSKLVIKGTSLSGQLTVEINGVDATTAEVGADKKAKIKGVGGSLHSGANRIRVRHGSLRSNIFIFTM